MGVIDYYKKTAEESKKLFSQNRDIIDAYNFHILKILLFFSVAACFILSMLSLIPAITMLYHLKFQIFFSASLCVFFIYAVISMFAAEFVSRHSVVAVYIYIIFADTFSVMVNLLTSRLPPYTVTIGFLVAVPMLMMDSRIRVMIVHVIIAAICLYLSYYFKSDDYFLTDCIDCFVFTSVGIFAGDRFRMNNIRYLDLKEHELDRNVEVLRAKNEAKTSFLANMSHEIRTPINAVLGLNEMILREGTEPNVLTYANEIQSAGRSLLSLINDILDFSKIEANKMVIIPVEYALDSMINDLANMIRPRAEERGLKLRISIDEKTPNVLYGDDVRIKQCILNLLTNAVKYTNEGYIDLNVSYVALNDRELNLTVHVKDTGAGIKPENLAKLFSAFERIEEKRFRTTEGTGLGITIVQRLLGKMDSSLQVESEYGTGSDFWFEIRQGIVKNEPIGKFSERIKEAESASHKSTYRELFHAPDAHILVVDDMKINLDVISGLLKRTRVQIDTALNGHDAIRMVQEHPYDLIFLDHRMPELDGIQTLHAMQKLNDSKNWLTPCIALTANAIYGAKEMYLKEGFADYISKPVDYNKLEELMIKHLPKNLVQKVSASGQIDSEEPVERDPFLQAYYKVDGINASAALDFCGDVEVLKGAVHDYYDSISMQSDLIEKYAEQGDIKNYMILVHGLKSSSRLVGAEKLSRDAAYLEQCAKDERLDEINKLTSELLNQFRSLKKPFAQVLGEKYVETEGQSPAKENDASAEEGAGQSKEGQAAEPSPESESAGQEEKKAMPEEQLRGALDAIAEFIRADDYGAAENILFMMEEYKIPLESDESYDKIKKAILAKDKDTALSLLAGE